MKQNFHIVTFLITFLAGCNQVTEYHNDIIVEDAFLLKQKCSQYIEKEKERFLKENPHLYYPLLEGSFYSKILKTCVAKWAWTNSEGQQFYKYVDVLTDKSLRTFLPFEVDQNGIIELDNNRHNEIVTSEAVDYEKILDLVQ